MPWNSHRFSAIAGQGARHWWLYLALLIVILGQLNYLPDRLHFLRERFQFLRAQQKEALAPASLWFRQL